MVWFSMSDHVTKHVEKNVMSGLQTERTCKQEKVTAMEQGEVRIRWEHDHQIHISAWSSTLVMMLLYQNHAEGLVRL